MQNKFQIILGSYYMIVDHVTRFTNNLGNLFYLEILAIMG